MAYTGDPEHGPARENSTDRELTPEYEAQEGGIGNIGTTRFGMPSWLSVAIVAVVIGIVVVLLLSSRQ